MALEKQSGSGITIGEMTLEEHLDKEEAKELETDTKEEIAEKKKSLYYEHRSVHNEKGKGRSSRTKRWSRYEINTKYWRKQMEAIGKSKPSVVELVIGALMDGAWLSPQGMADRIKDATGKDIRGVDCSWRLTSMNKSELGLFIERKKVSPRRFEYSLAHPIVVHCTPDEVRKLFLKNNKEVTAKILREKHPDVAAYMDKRKIKATLEVKPGGVKKKVTVPAADVRATALNKLIGDQISSALGLDVKVSGDIQVTFRFVAGEKK